MPPSANQAFHADRSPRADRAGASTARDDADASAPQADRLAMEIIDQRIIRYLTQVMSWTGIALCLASVPTVMIVAPHQMSRMALGVLAGLAGALGLWQVRGERVKSTAYALLWGYWLLIVCACIFNGGVGAPALSAIVLLSVYATLALGLRQAMLLCLATLVLCIGLLYGEHHGAVPLSVPSELRAVMYLVLAVMSALMLWTTSTILHQAVLLARVESTRRAEVVRQLSASQGELHRLNAELEHRVAGRTAELTATNEELMAFSYSVAHDLRAPLRAINGFSSEVIEECRSLLPAGSLKDLQRIRTASDTMDILIDGMLRLSRITRMDLHRQPVDLSALAHEVIADLRQGDPERAVEVTITDGLIADGDHQLLRILLDNLLGNAWKYSARSANAAIRFTREERDGVSAFAVHDNGAGFDMRYSAKLFGAFQRLHSPGEFSGMGIGLATARRIISRHSGRIWATGQVGAGASFWFTLDDQGGPGAPAA
jgi:signal transduction histidine kinase